MRPLIVLSARSACLAVLLILATGLSGGLVRLLPWLVAPEVPWRLCVPFARLLLGTAVEVAVLVGMPLGVALGASTFVERGEARALAALGASVARLVLPLAAPGLVTVALYVAVASTEDPEPPGRLAARLIAAGRATCEPGGPPQRVDVPLVSLTWLCLSGQPKLAGRVPGLGDRAWFTAADVVPSAELGSVSLTDLRFVAQVGSRVLRLHARNARLIGLPRWGKPLSLSGAARGAVIGVGALGAALAAAWLVVSRALASPFASTALAGTAALSMLLALRAADARALPPIAYGLVPICGLLSLLLVALGLEAVRRIARGRAG
jgi:hypothetical protein